MQGVSFNGRVAPTVGVANPDSGNRFANERGASMLEYALIAASIAVVLIFSTTVLGRETSRSIKRTRAEICLVNDKELNPEAYAPRPPGGGEGEPPGNHCYD